MMYEVEVKFRVADLADCERRLRERGAQPGRTVTQHDRYFNHPQRDFANTDEALRVRQVAGETRLTYKGPRIDRETKTREEIELPVGEGKRGAAELATVLQRLGFSLAGEVQKRRREFHLAGHGRPVAVALDEVEGLGCFVELEAVADSVESVPQARSRVLELASDLGFGASETRSYLELLARAGDESP